MLTFETINGFAIDLLPAQDVTLTLENAFFTSDRIPIAWSTDFDLPASSNNLQLFGLSNAMLIKASTQKINVVMKINSVPIMFGNIKLMGHSQSGLEASFSGVAMEDSLIGSLKDAPLNKWNFGKLTTTEETTRYNELTTSAARGTREDFATPLMMRDSEKDTDDIFVDPFSQATKLHFASKYMNSNAGKFIVPVVRLKYLVRMVFSDCEIDSEFASYIDKIGIVAPYRNNGSLNDIGKGCLDKDESGNYILDLAAAMPDVAIVDFIKDILKSFGGTIYISDQGKQLIGNNTILKSSFFEDWTEKINGTADQDYEEGRGLEYGFSGVEDVDIKEIIANKATIDDCFDATEGSLVYCEQTQDYYRVTSKQITIGLTNGETSSWSMPHLQFVKQGGMITIESNHTNVTEKESSVSGFTPAKCHPCHFFQGGWAFLGKTSIMVPVISVPPVGGARSSDIYFGTIEIPGTLEDCANPFADPVQLTSNGCYGAAGILISPFRQGDTPLSIRGESGLYEKYHKSYANWLGKDKSVVRTKVNLSAHDISRFKIWKKIMLYNQLFFIKSLSITVNTSLDWIDTDVDLITS